MLKLLAKTMFEATRLSPHPNAISHDWRKTHNVTAHRKIVMSGDAQKMKKYAIKQQEFVQLHNSAATFLMPNVWDAGTARILEGLGFKALATTSAGFAFSLGLRDSSGSLSRDQVLKNARLIVDATTLPVSADLENGFGESPYECAKTIREAARIGLCGGSIEDATGDPSHPIYSFNLAVERIHAAVEAKPSENFMITARADNLIYGEGDLEHTIRRLMAFEQAGADVLYAPGLSDYEAVKTLCAAVSRPVNVVVGLSDTTYTVENLSTAGVRRVSTGGSLARAALGEVIRAACELHDQGTYHYAERAISDADAAAKMRSTKRVTFTN